MRKSIWLAGLIVIFPLFSVDAHADAPSIQLQVQVSPREIYIGDPIEYRAIVVFSSSVSMAPVEPPNPWGEFETWAQESSPPQIAKTGLVHVTHRFVLTTFSTGTQILPPLSLKFVTAQGQAIEAQTEEFDIQVKSLLEEKGDKGNLMPLKGLFGFRSFAAVWILAGILAALGLAFFLYKFLKNRKKGAELEEHAKRPPDEEAWEALYQLEQSDLLKNGQAKEFYFQLSIIFRRYLENRFRFSALDRTSSELLMEFRYLKLAPEFFAVARKFLENADLVKFAKLTPSEDEVDQDVGRVKQMVSLTTPQKEEPKTEMKEISV